MKKIIKKIVTGYKKFRDKYAHGDRSIMQNLSTHGQKPEIMVVACCDSRVDPALVLQCNPGDLFVVRNVANIVPPYEHDMAHHGTSAALEFGIRFLKVKDLILFGHSQCSGIQILLNNPILGSNDFLSSWVSIIKTDPMPTQDADEYAQIALHKSYDHCMEFPWIQERVRTGDLNIHLWFFDIQEGQIFTYCDEEKKFIPFADLN